MSLLTNPAPVHIISPMKYTWLFVLAAGIILFTVLDLSLRATGNTGLLTAVLFLGAFTIPISLVIYFYDHIRDHDISRPLLAACFMVGGGLGLLAAGLVEFGTLRTLGLGALIAVGFIEEAAKLIFPLFMYTRKSYRHEADGLLFGVAAGMGFAALETMGYGLLAFVQSQGSIGSLEQTLLLRGLLSPAGHVAWTGLVCAVLWRERQRAGHALINLKVLVAFLLAVTLHTSWDIVNTLNMPAAVSYGGMIVISTASLTFLLMRYRESRRTLPGADITA